MSSFHSYSNNTKNIYIIICIALVLIVLNTIASNLMGVTKVFALKFIALTFIAYALYKLSFETYILMKDMPQLFSDPSLSGIRNNTLLSCTLCLLMTSAFVYVLLRL